MFAFLMLNYIIIGNHVRGHLPVKQPSFKSLPMSLKSEENETIFLPCIVEDLGGSSVRWWKDGSLVSDSANPTVEVPPKFTVLKDGMSVDSLTLKDGGEYTCELLRPKPWSSLRQTHLVQVLHPPKIYPTPSDGYVEVNKGGRVRMGCAVAGEPSPSITWKTKGLFLNSTQAQGQVLEFAAVSRFMSGAYQCEANNGIGGPVHFNFNLRILHKPEIEVEKSWVHSAPGIKTALACRTVADPEARVTWMFNGAPMKVSPPRVVYQVREGNHVLLFESVAVSDFGNYSCKAHNKIGSSQGFLQLSGVANPVIIKKVEKKSPTEFSIIWEVDSYSPIFDYKFHFRKQGGTWVSFVIPADSSSSGPLHSKSYTFIGLDKFLIYEAKIFARNRFGWSNSSELVSFGYMIPELTEDKNLFPEEIIGSSQSIASRFPASHQIIIFFILTTKFFLNIYGIS